MARDSRLSFFLYTCMIPDFLTNDEPLAERRGMRDMYQKTFRFSLYSSLHLLPTFTAARRTGQSTADSVSRSRSAITAARQIEATSRFVPCANSPTPTTGTLTPI